jgi:ferric-dicitrate binding protein FerR (iron transport regulator)
MMIKGVYMENKKENKLIDKVGIDEKLDKATDWLLLLNQNEIEEEYLLQFKSWLIDDQDNQKYFKEVLQVWQLSALIEVKSLEKIQQILGS